VRRARGSQAGAAARAGLVVALLVAFGCTSASRREPEAPDRPALRTMRGKASYYGRGFHGRKTASGERFDMHAFTAAHRTLRFGTLVRVTNRKNGRSVVVRINDRGPFGRRKRIIDVSHAAARKLGMMKAGVVPVTLEVLQEPPPRARRR